MIVLYRGSGKWELSDETEVIAVYLTAQDKANIAGMDDEANVYMTFDPAKGYHKDFLVDELKRAEALAMARAKKLKEEVW